MDHCAKLFSNTESYLECDFPDERRALVRGEDGELVVVEEA